MTAGVNGPNFDTLAIVHFAAWGGREVHTDAPANAGRDDKEMGVAATNAGVDIVDRGSVEVEEAMESVEKGALKFEREVSNER